MVMSLHKLQKMVKDRETWLATVHAVVNSRTWLSNWTTEVFFLTPRPSVLSYLLDIPLLHLNSHITSISELLCTIAWHFHAARNLNKHKYIYDMQLSSVFQKQMGSYYLSISIYIHISLDLAFYVQVYWFWPTCSEVGPVVRCYTVLGFMPEDQAFSKLLDKFWLQLCR